MQANRVLLHVVAGILLVGFMAEIVWADVLPPGHKNVSHEMVFVPSDALNTHRLVAAPLRGFHGEMEVSPGQPFRFSSKYGTRFYLVPEDIEPLPEFDRETYAQWPSADPPRGEIRSVPLISPVASALTTVRFSRVDSDKPIIELVDHVEYDGSGKAVSWTSYLVRPLMLVPAGCVLLLLTVVLVRRSSKKAVQQP